MGNLPERRLQPSPPFSTVGVDYAGPYLIKDRKGRGCKISKCYVCLFVCFSTKAVHLELVTDLTKDSFLLSLRRFASRRGTPSHVYSDNGTNFVAASSELRELGKFLISNSNKLIETFANEHIQWYFIPPNSPHFGGLWEAGVKSMKSHLKRVMGSTYLTFEELYTLLVQVEAILNSRPLCPISTDPNDLIPLTPAHFLVGRPLTALPTEDVRDIQLNRLSRYQYLLQLKQHVWERWNKEFISELQQRCKWKQSHGSLKQDDLVVIKEDNLPPMNWKLGRIKTIFPGPDGIARVATIKTTNGDVKRAFSKICPLPVNRVSPQETI